MGAVNASRIVGGFLAAPLIGISLADLSSFWLWAWTAPGIDLDSWARLSALFAYMLVAGVAAFFLMYRRSHSGFLYWLAFGALGALPACALDIWPSAGTGFVSAEPVLRYLALYVFAGALTGAAFWLLAGIGNNALARRSSTTAR